MPRSSDAELARVSEEQRKLARVFLTYALTAPITDEDLAVVAQALREALGAGYSTKTTLLGADRARFEVYAPSGVRIADRLLLAIPA